MKLVRIDGLAPGGAEIELHPQLTVLRGVSPELRRRLVELFRSFSGASDPGCSGLIEISGVQLGLDRPTLEGLRLDPHVDAVLDWGDVPAVASGATSGVAGSGVTGSAPASGSAAGTSAAADSEHVRWDPPVPVATAAAVAVDHEAMSERLANERDRLRAVTTERSELGRRMDEVRAGLDSFATAALEVCVGQIDALESRRSMLRSQWERDRAARLQQRAELDSMVRRHHEELEAVSALDLEGVRSARQLLADNLQAPIEPDPVANELALQLDHALRSLRELRGRAASAELRRREAEQRLAEATQDAASAEHSLRTRVFDPADISRLEKVRDEIFAFDDRRIAAHRNKRKVQELRAEQAVLLERLGFDTYSSYVMGIPSLRAELERSSRLDAATSQIEQIERELQSISADTPDPRELRTAENDLRRLLIGALDLLGDDTQLSTPPSAPLSTEPAVAEGSGEGAASAEDIVHETVTRLRARRVADTTTFDSDALIAADRLRAAVRQLGDGRFGDPEGVSAPIVAGRQIRDAAWVGSPQDLLDGVDLWLSEMVDVSDWVERTHRDVDELSEHIAELDRDDLQRSDVSEWAVVEAELDAALDRLAVAEERVRSHDLAMAQLAELRDTELGLRARERELLSTVARLEQERRDRPRPAPGLPPTTRLPPVYHPPTVPGEEHPAPPVSSARSTSAGDLEWSLIERLAGQRSVSFIGSVPLLVQGMPVDGPARAAVCERARRMGELVQIIVLSDDDAVRQWALSLGHAAAVRPV